ncbi:MAG: SDR family NAD(P)-dependent oxidoreductase, partial [Rhodoferax sp.]|nr:SDR family NAD(P)-dependent oxidoreductase [Rhodoferax sp.]
MKSTFEKAFDLQGKVALITGAAAGIGRATAALFAEQGARLVLLDRSESVVATAALLGTEHLGLVCDVSEVDQIRA